MSGCEQADQKQRALPPIHRIVEPKMAHMSTRIRWFSALGYTNAEIHKHLGVRYQQVRNVLTTTPKRMAREDLPALDVVVMDVETDLEAMEAQALVDNMAAQRAEDRAARKRARRGQGIDGEGEADDG